MFCSVPMLRLAGAVRRAQQQGCAAGRQAEPEQPLQRVRIASPTTPPRQVQVHHASGQNGLLLSQPHNNSIELLNMHTPVASSHPPHTHSAAG